MRAARLFVLGLTIALASLAGCSRGKSGAPAATPTGAPGSTGAASAPDQPVTVTVETVALERVERTVDFVGTLRANAEAEVATEVDGRLLTIEADLGDQVSDGQVLASLDSATLDAQLREATANLQKTSTDEARAGKLKAQGVISQQEFDTISSARLVAQARRDVLAIHLAHTRIRAPFAGRIAKRMVDVGNFVRIGTPVVVLVADDPLRLRGEVPERFVSDLALGQEVRGTVEAFPGDILKGRLARVSAAADSTSRAVTVEATVPNPDGKLKVGFFCKAAILTRSDADAIVVPVEALVTFAGVTRVFVVDDTGTARSRPVRTGLALGTKIEITAGLAPGDRVATSALARLAEGSRVTVRTEAEAGKPDAEASAGTEKRS